MITAREVHDAEFRRAAAGTPGYDEVAVDDFLDRVVATLTALEQGNSSVEDTVTSHEVVEAEFPERGADVNGGYDMDDVDDLLDRVAQRLFAAETSGSNGGEALHADDEWEPASELSDDDLADPRRDDGGVGDAAALAVASGAPRGAVQSGTRADDEWQNAAVNDGVLPADDDQRDHAELTPERGFDEVDDSRGGSFGEPGVRVPQVRPDGSWDEEPGGESRHETFAEPGVAEPGVQVPRVRPDGSWDDDEHAHHEAPAFDAGDAHSQSAQASGFLGADADASAQDDHRTQRVVDAEDVAGDSERRGLRDEHVVEAGAGGRVVDDAVEGDEHVVDAERTAQQDINPVGGEPLDEAADARDEARREASQASAQVHPVGGGLAATDHELKDDEGADDDSGRDAVASVDESADKSDDASRGVTIERVERVDEPGDERTATIRPSMGQSWTGGAADDDASAELAQGADDVDEQHAQAQSAGEVPVVHEPVSEESIISYPATDHRVPLPRGDVRRAMSDADREAEGHYHPEFSAYATPEVVAEPAGSEIPPVEPPAPRSEVAAEHQSEPRHLDETRAGSAADLADDGRSSADRTPAEAAMADPAAADSVLDHAGADGDAFHRTPADATPASTETGATTESSPWDEPMVTRDPAVASHPSDVAADDPFADEAPVAAFDPRAGNDFDPFAQPSGPAAMTPRVPSPAQVGDAGAPHGETPTSRDAALGSRREASAHVGEAFESRDETSASDAHTAALDDESSATGNAATEGDDEAPVPAFAALRRVAPANEEVARVREPHDDRDSTGAPAPVAAELARRAAERERLAGLNEDADAQAAGGVTDDAWGVGRPEPIEPAEPIDAVAEPEQIEAPKPLPPRDDTSRKGILRRIFKS